MPDASARAAATCGNFGPGFDVFSLALALGGDRVRLRDASQDEVRVTGIGAESIRTEWSANCASIVVEALRRKTGVVTSLRVDVEKGIPPGSGLGSSASSSAAAALAFAEAFGAEAPLTRDDLLDAAAEGERAVSGDHRDDVSAALLGGLAVVSPRDTFTLPPPDALRLAIVRPHAALPTREMRALIPSAWPRADVVANLAAVARMVLAFERGDVPGIGRALEDRLALPYREKRVPRLAECRRAAMDAGAFGFALAGSGPSMVAVADSDALAGHVAGAMSQALAEGGVPHDRHVARAHPEVDLSAFHVH